MALGVGSMGKGKEGGGAANGPKVGRRGATKPSWTPPITGGGGKAPVVGGVQLGLRPSAAKPSWTSPTTGGGRGGAPPARGWWGPAQIRANWVYINAHIMMMAGCECPFQKMLLSSWLCHMIQMFVGGDMHGVVEVALSVAQLVVQLWLRHVWVCTLSSSVSKHVWSASM